ncbi:hypothetical protein [Streptomyces nigra]|nr:hypothetical protein [Streptomyces nigra]
MNPIVRSGPAARAGGLLILLDTGHTVRITVRDLQREPALRS